MTIIIKAAAVPLFMADRFHFVSGLLTTTTPRAFAPCSSMRDKSTVCSRPLAPILQPLWSTITPTRPVICRGGYYSYSLVLPPSQQLRLTAAHSDDGNETNDDDGGSSNQGNVESKDDPSNTRTTPKMIKTTTARIGGRSSLARRQKINDTTKNSDSHPNKFRWFGLVVGSIMLAVFLLQNVLFGTSSTSSSSVVYFERSYYETRTYGADGKLETTNRKEQMRSYIPSLLLEETKSQQQQQQQQPTKEQSSISNTLMRLPKSWMEDIDEDIVDMDDLLEIPRTLQQLQMSSLDDFF